MGETYLVSLVCGTKAGKEPSNKCGVCEIDDCEDRERCGWNRLPLPWPFHHTQRPIRLAHDELVRCQPKDRVPVRAKGPRQGETVQGPGIQERLFSFAPSSTENGATGPLARQRHGAFQSRRTKDEAVGVEVGCKNANDQCVLHRSA